LGRVVGFTQCAQELEWSVQPVRLRDCQSDLLIEVGAASLEQRIVQLTYSEIDVQIEDMFIRQK